VGEDAEAEAEAEAEADAAANGRVCAERRSNGFSCLEVEAKKALERLLSMSARQVEGSV